MSEHSHPHSSSEQEEDEQFVSLEHGSCCRYIPSEAFPQRFSKRSDILQRKVEIVKNVLSRDGFYISTKGSEFILATDRLEDLAIHVLLVDSLCRQLGIRDQVTLF